MKEHAGIDEVGVVVQPSVLGVDLFHWAHGKGNLHIHSFLASHVTFETDFEVPDGASTL